MKFPLPVLVLLVSPVVMAAVGNSDLQEIRALVAQGKHEEALQKHLWFHEESKTSTGMGGVRLSFALSQWAELGVKYPKALDALHELRDRNVALLLEGTGSFPEFHEVHAINRTLKEPEKTYALFTQLHARQPGIAKRCFDVAMDLIVENKDYELCGAYLGDPVLRYERSRQMRETHLSMMKQNPNLDTAAFRERADRTFTQKTLQLLDILQHLKRTDEAREIQKRALAYFPSAEVEASLPRR